MSVAGRHRERQRAGRPASPGRPAPPAGCTRPRSRRPVSASATPRRSRSARAEVGQQQDAGRRERHPDQVERVARSRDRHAERPHELERDRDAQRDPVERLVVGEVHRHEHEAVGEDQPPVGAPSSPAARAARARRGSARRTAPAGTPCRRGPPRRTASSRTRRRTGPRPPPPSTRTVGGIRSARIMAVHRTAARERTYEELERIFAGVDAPFAFVDLDAMWSNAAEMLERAAGHADPGGEQVGPLPAAAAVDPGARRLSGTDDLHAPRVALAPRARLRRPAARLPDRRPRRARRAPPAWRTTARRSSWSTRSSTST